MGRYLTILGAFLIAFSFQQSEGKALHQPKEDLILLGNRRFQLADNLTLQGFMEQCTTEADIFRCCIGFESGLNVTACISIQYLEDEYGLELNVTLNSLYLYHEKVSAKNPPPICFHVPYLEKIADACFRIHDLEVKQKNLTGCVDLEGHIEYLKVFKFRLGCFSIPMSFLGRKMYEVNFMKNNII